MKILGFIPARSGSKGVKNKNIKEIKRVPLIEFTVFTAIKSMEKGYLSDVLVSSAAASVEKNILFLLILLLKLVVVDGMDVDIIFGMVLVTFFVL